MGADDRRDPLDALVDGVRRGDRDAIAAVYLAVGPALRGFLRRRVPHGEVADDLVEQVFVALIEEGSSLRGDGRSLRAWLFRVARNDLYDWAKRAERRSEGGAGAEQLARFEDPDGDPGELVPAASIDPRLVAALAQLTADQREVVELRLVADLSLLQVADITGRTVGAVKLLQHRAVRRLASLLGAPSFDP